MKVFSFPECKPIKAWTDHVPFDEAALQQVRNIASLPFIYKHVAIMPDVHLGKGATVGSVIVTKNAVVPASVGVDIGCGMMALRTSLTAHQLPDSLAALRTDIEAAVPHGFTTNQAAGQLRGAHDKLSDSTRRRWFAMDERYRAIMEKHPKLLEKREPWLQLGTLGGGNHFIEVCLDLEDRVWVMLHSGSRGIGNAIGTYFIEKAKEEMKRFYVNLPDTDLSYLPQGSMYFDDYVEAVEWAQEFAMENRKAMMEEVLKALRRHLPEFSCDIHAVNCHHNYISRESHFGENVFVTRKGAVRARAGDLGIIPGSMGARSFIVRGLGNADSFHSCSHGAGRVMSRTKAKQLITIEQHVKATEGVECRKDADVIDESPAAYKNIEDVMRSQEDLVEIQHELRQVLCVKG